MRYLFFKSIKIQLLLLVLISVLPALGIVIYSGLDRQHHEIEDAKDNALRVVQSLAYEHERAVENTRRFLMALAKLPDIRNLNIPASNKLLRELLKQNPLYGNIFVLNAEGVLCSSAMPFTPQSLKNRKYFQDILRTKAFSAGEYVVGVAIMRPVLHFASPILNTRGEFKGAVGVAFDLARYGEIFTVAKLPENSTLTLSDQKNIRLHRYPYPEKYVGKSDYPDMVKHMSAQPEEGVFTSIRTSGTKYLFVYKRLYLKGSTSPYLFIRVGIPYEQAFFHARKTLFISMALFGLSFLIAMVSAWFLGNVIIVRRLNKLVSASEQLRHGDLSIRTGLAHNEDEVGRLANTFDKMAAELEQKDSQRKLAEEALKLSEKKYRSIFENAAEGICQVKPEGKFISINPAMAHMYGYESPEEMITSVTDIKKQLYVDPEERLKYRALLEEYGVVKNFEHKSYKKDGAIIWVSLNARVVKDVSGNVLYFDTMVEDITRRKEAEESLKREKETMFAILESDPSGVTVVGRDGVYQYANPEFTKITGYTLTDIRTGRDWFQRAYPDPEYRKKVIEAWKKNTEKEGKSVDVEFTITCKDDSRKDIEFRSTLLKDFSITVLNDITDRKQAETLLKESEERYRILTEESTVGVYIVQKNLFRYVNDAFAQIHGYMPDEMVDKLGPMDFVLPEDLPLITEGTKKQGSGEVKDAHFELRTRRRDGVIRHVEIFIARSQHKGAPAVLGTLVDITERKHLEEQLHIMSIVDDLTGLYNRRGFFTLAQQQLKLSERTPRGMILFFIDIDRMKWINDTLGHQEGDRALTEVAAILRQTFRETDIIGRMGGDEFAILAIDATDETKEALMKRLQNILDSNNKLENRKYILSLSVGTTHYDPENPVSLDALIAGADVLMYEKKKNKRY